MRLLESITTIFAAILLIGCSGSKLGIFLPSSTPATAHTNTNAPQANASPTPSSTTNGTTIPTPTATPTAGPTSIPTPTQAPTPTVTPIAVQITFYSYLDNGNSTTITYPTSQGYFTVHNSAGGTGTFNDPVTAASATAVFQIGMRLYVPALLKYVVMESSCVFCNQDWSSSGKRDLNIWSGGDQTTPAAPISNCENLLVLGVAQSSAGSGVIPNPPNGLTVDPTPLYQAVPPTATGTFSWMCYF
jgi:hypothetical protein